MKRLRKCCKHEHTVRKGEVRRRHSSHQKLSGLVSSCFLLPWQTVINSAHVLSKRARRRHGSPHSSLAMAWDGIVPGPGPRDGWQRSLPVWTQGPGALFTICGPCAKYRRERDSATAQGRRGALSSCKSGLFPFFLFTSICSHQSPFPRDESVLRSGLSFILSRLSAPTHFSGAVVCLWLNHTCLFLLTSPADPWLQNNRPKVEGYRRKGGRVW